MFNDVGFKYLCTLALVSVLIELTDCGALSIFEQKKYKRLTDGQGLYSSKDDVEILTIDNFKNEIYGNQRAFLVEFYNTWCGHCQRFAPSWKALATDVKEWRDLVGIGAIDCSNDQNYPICRNMEIMGYPTVKFYHDSYQEDPKNLGVKIDHGSDLKEHRQKLLEIIIKEQSDGRGNIFPIILPYTASDLSEIFQKDKEAPKYTFLIIQEPADFVGPEVTMDLHRVKDITVRYTYNNNSVLINSLKASDDESVLYAVDRDMKIRKVKTLGSTRENLRVAIRNFLESKHIQVPVTEKKDIFKGKWMEAKVPDMSEFMHERERKALKEKVKKMGDVVFQMDLETALRYSLKHEVGTVKEISGEKLQALREYVNVLEKYFPFGKFGHMFLVQLKYFVNNHDTIDGDVIANFVKNAEKEDQQVFSTPEKWLACEGSSPNYRGYPCGLWKMFHYLTINAADHSIGLRGTNPKIVLQAMHGYIKHFFGCTDCSKHFLEMAKRRELDKVSSWNDSILWLWLAHNEVNKRLSGDATEDPDYPKQQFPTKEKCPQCYKKDDTWDIAEVLRYLKHVYSSINVRYIGSDTKILHLGLDGTNFDQSDRTVLRKLEAYLCIIMYFSTFGLILFVIKMFWRRRSYRKKAYHHSLLGKV